MTTEVITGLSKDSNLTSDFRDGNYSEHIASENKTCDNIVTAYSEGIITKDQHRIAMFLIFQIFMPLICSVGFVGNLMSVIVLFQSRDKNAFSTYLKALTLSDVILLFFGLVQFVSKVVQDYLTHMASFINVYVHLVVNFGTFNFARSLSSLLITILSIDRFVSVAFPLTIKDFVLEKHPKTTIVILLVIEIILRTPTIVWTEVKSYPDCMTNLSIYYLEYREWSKDPILRRAFFWFLIVFDMFVPVLTVLLMNMSILITLKRRPSLSVANRKRETKGAFEEKKILITLMLLSIFYILSVLPYMSAYILATLRPDFTLVSKEFYLYSIIIDTNILLVTLNAANDFIIYILASNRFRALFMIKYFRWRGAIDRQGTSVRKTSIMTVEGSIKKKWDTPESSVSGTLVEQLETSRSESDCK